MRLRTTHDIDDDVIAAARESAASERRSLGAVMRSSPKLEKTYVDGEPSVVAMD
jgi:hypothetical protein